MDDVEYRYTTNPRWAMDAVMCTDTGVELNFEKLSLLCPSEDLPANITIELVSTPSHTADSNRGSNKTIQNGVKTNIREQRNGDHALIKSAQKSKDPSPDSTETTKPGLPRTESIIQREIRLQREREEELRLERQLITGLSVQTNVTQNDKQNDEQNVHQTVRYATEHPIRTEMNQVKKREEELRERRQSLDSTASSNISLPTTTSSQEFSPGSVTSHTNSYTPVYATPDIKPRRNSKIVSPLCEEETKSPINWFLDSESPINRDIRLSQQRERELKISRQESVSNST